MELGFKKSYQVTKIQLPTRGAAFSLITVHSSKEPCSAFLILQ